jgi:signal peptidase II
VKKQGSRGLIWSFVVIFLVLLFDQILKIWVKTSMTLNQEISVIGSWFNLLFVENNGMAFGWLG